MEKEKRLLMAAGDESTFLTAFLDARVPVMAWKLHTLDLSRLNAQRKFLSEENYDLVLPLEWTMYGEEFSTENQIDEMP